MGGQNSQGRTNLGAAGAWSSFAQAPPPPDEQECRSKGSAMTWFSDVSTAPEFRAAALRDSDMVVVHPGNLRLARTLGSVLDDCRELRIFGKGGRWIAWVRRNGRKIEVSISTRTAGR